MGLVDKQIDLIGDAYENYCKEYEMGKHLEGSGLLWMSKETMETFIYRIKTDDEFSKRWGITVETGELSQRERCKLLYKSWEQNGISPEHKEVSTLWVEYNNLMKKYNIPTKLTTINYNGQIQEIYE